MTPILNPTTQHEETYNVSHCSKRHFVECAFGILKSRFTCLRSGISCLSPKASARIIYACFILHNMLQSAKRLNFDVQNFDFNYPCKIYANAIRNDDNDKEYDNNETRLRRVQNRNQLVQLIVEMCVDDWRVAQAAEHVNGGEDRIQTETGTNVEAGFGRALGHGRGLVQGEQSSAGTGARVGNLSKAALAHGDGRGTGHARRDKSFKSRAGAVGNCANDGRVHAERKRGPGCSRTRRSATRGE